MNKKMPRTPLSTPLSVSAGETEINNPLSRPKKRPFPLSFLILTACVCIFCGNLVSCQFKKETPPDTSQSTVSQPDSSLQPDVSQQMQDIPDEMEQNPPESPGISSSSDTSKPASPNHGDQSAPDQGHGEFAPYDSEVCLSRDGFPTPIGPGNWVELMFSEFKPEVAAFEEGEPIYQPGDYWDTWSIGDGGDNGGVSALRYYIAAENRWSLQRLETGRTDMYTPRGIRVGSTREEVLAAYPGLLSDEKNWQWAYPDDYLWYCANENGSGPCLYFFFADDVVYLIQMVDMFN